jgi:hypothetical protein
MRDCPTRFLTIITLFVFTLTNGQVCEKDVYKNIEDLTVVDSVSWKDIANGFCISSGTAGYRFRLDSSGTFEKIDFDCVSKFKVDSGTWTIRNHNMVVLESTEQILEFDIVKFSHFYFFVLPTQTENFVKDLQATKIQFKNIKSIVVDGDTITSYNLIGRALAKKYYTTEIAYLADSGRLRQ